MKPIDFVDGYGNRYSFEFDLEDIVIRNLTAKKLMVVPIYLIQKQSEVWDFQSNYLELSAEARTFIEKLVKEKIMILI